MSREFLPYGRQYIDDDDIAAVVSVLRSDFLTTGPAVEAFESRLAETVGARFAVACSSGTAALHMAMAVFEFGEGVAVAVPTLTFLATANAVRYVGAEVEFVDVDPETGLSSGACFLQAMQGSSSNRLQALAPVHLAGQVVDMPAVASLARERGLRVVEDAAHALGTTYLDERGHRVRVGSCQHSDMAIFSFHPVKTIAMGEGGAVTTNDQDLYEALLRFRNHGINRVSTDFANRDLGFAADGSANPWYYEMPALGYNYRATDIHCALGLSQLDKLPRFLRRRRELVEIYDRELARLAPAISPLKRVPGCEPGWHLYPILIDFAALGLERATLMRALRDRGVGTQVHYIPVHLQPYYRGRYGAARMPGAEAYYGQTLSLPLYFGMEESDVVRAVAALAEVIAVAK